MKIADLYIRVSTDEQADKGYSQRDQEERLKKYCEINSIKVRKVIFEDHSAKTFDRPQWTKLLVELKKQKGKHSDFIFFTKWDRFSRNAGDAYQMINILKKLGIEPQAVEQPLDMTIPENKIMLAFYLAAPEVENDRRALNVFHGMRRARKEGRYMGVAPIGYANKISEDGRKYIAPKEPEASYIRWIFEQLGTGIYGADQIRKMANEKGFPISRSNFYREIRNPVYCGRIVVGKYKDEDQCTVPGQHESIIAESLFYKVQDILEGKERPVRTKCKSMEAFPLRGFLDCAKCDRQLTGSASKGKKGGYYFYYHAQAEYGCGCRYKAEVLNEAFVKELQKFVPKPGMVELYQEIIQDIYKNNFGETRNQHVELTDEIKKINDRVNNARDMLFDNKIDPDDFKILKRKVRSD